jgi:hypothetical protein
LRDYLAQVDLPGVAGVTTDTILTIRAGKYYSYHGLAAEFLGPELRQALNVVAKDLAGDTHGYWRLADIWRERRWLNADKTAWSRIEVVLDPDWIAIVRKRIIEGAPDAS